MKVLEIIKATEKSKELGFYKGIYLIEEVGQMLLVNNERHQLYHLETIVLSGATIRIIEK